MSEPRDPAGAARRLAIWAGLLVLPVVLGALLLPRIAGSLRAAGPGGAAAGPKAATPRAGGPGGGLAGLGALMGEQPAAEAAPRPPEGPTRDQIEAARDAELELAKAQETWKRTQTIAPRLPTRDASGELVSPFQGFGLSVESRPAGAQVVVNGRDLGETPLVTTVACKPGDPVDLVVERRGFKPHRQSVRCRADALVTVPVTLRK